jgi:D-aminopeptidase
VRPEHVTAAIADARGGRVQEGNVGGGTGMVCHEFKGGIGTASRHLEPDEGGWTVGVLVQSNYGRRGLLRVDGVPVGSEIGIDRVPSPYGQEKSFVPFPGELPNEPGTPARARDGSIIILVATDAPVLPHQCRRIAQRASLGLARAGGYGSTTSGDLILCFATGNRSLHPPEVRGQAPGLNVVETLFDRALDPLFEATVEATEEAIVNALVAADTMTGRDGITAHRLPHDRLVEVMRQYGRLRA